MWARPVHTHSPSTWELEAEGSGVSGHPELQSRLEVSLGYMRPPLKGSKKQDKSRISGEEVSFLGSHDSQVACQTPT